MKVGRGDSGAFRVVEGDAFVGADSNQFAPWAPANDVLGLRDEEPYVTWLQSRWGQEATPRRARAWIRGGDVDQLVRAARRVGKGQTPAPAIGSLLERVRVEPRSIVTAPTLAHLAAWSIDRSWSQGVAVTECPECRRPRIGPRLTHPYCYRPAPGKTVTCAQLHAQERFAEKRKAWDREYRRIYQRKLRGTVSHEEWRRWRDDPHGSARAPELYTTFDEWRTPEFRERIDEFERFQAAIGQRQSPAARFDRMVADARQLANEETTSSKGEH